MPRRQLVAHRLDGLGAGSDECQPMLGTQSLEGRTLGQKTITRIHCCVLKKFIELPCLQREIEILGI